MEEIFIKNNNLIEEPEWKALIKNIETNFNNLETNKQRAKRKLKDSLINSIKNRTRDIGNFGILFSGGIDSTLIAFICKSLKKNFTCYTVGLENSKDIEAAKTVADFYNLNLKYKTLALDEFENIVKETAPILNENDVMKVSVGSVLYAASKLALKDNIHTLFTGLGSEELFAGYQRHEESLKENNFENLHKECWNGLKKMHERDLKRDFLISKKLNITLLTPFLDIDLIKTAMSIHPMYKIDKTNKKIILREAAEELGLKKSFAQREKKAAQYGSNFIKGLDKLAKKYNFEFKKDYLQSLI
ncbi:asparagine synthase [Candidatus Woesearchaeota archaeon]|nr:asparagine synthase [Candidatus Woesearchaeota archaeon]